MSLSKYLSKRNLKKSLEPAARLFKRKKGSLEFVIQKHAATHLHYDLRLEVDGVLKSWAIPKEPSLDPSIKRLAMMVEDHPFDYRNFEGIIPSGYGAGTVEIWDKGIYSVEEKSKKDSEELMRKGLKKGLLHFTLKGHRLKGNFSLVRMKKEKNEWLLIKKKDAFSQEDEIKINPEVLGEKKTMPHGIKPMLATLVDKPFDDPQWLFEIKWDGFRAIAELEGPKVNIYSRNLISFNSRFPELVAQLKKQKLNAILDGEIVVLDEKGISHFQLLQNLSSEENLYYYVFDIIYLNGKDLRQIPLVQRKNLLKQFLKSYSHIRYSEHIEKNGEKFFKMACKMGCEGIIGKKKTSLYKSDLRTNDWVKIKAVNQQEVIICGYTEPRKSRKHIGALIIGVYNKGTLSFAGHVGGGFTEEKLKEVKKLLLPLVTETCPFKEKPRTNAKVTWVKPYYLCEVKFQEWTKDKIMRQPIFLGIRTDKPVKSVIPEKPKSKKEIVKKSYNFITNPTKIFWPEEKITKGDVLAYYEFVAPFILPYLKDRPESLRRFPEGISKPHFFQKNLIKKPEWISTVKIEHSDKTVNYLIIEDVKSLLYAVNLGCIEIHPLLSKYQSIDYPDFLLLDLDPVNISFDAVIETALEIHRILDDLEIAHYCKTSGSRGLHICIPLNAQYTYEQSKQFAEIIAQITHRHLPSITSLERSPKKRSKKVYIDYLQNNFGQTMAAPYSLRAQPKAPVSTPLEWQEVQKGCDPLDFNILTIKDRLKKKPDFFKPILQRGINMTRALKKIKPLL